MTPPVKLYHVTPEINRESIERGGIDPKYSRGKMPVCWFVNAKALDWAILHVSAKYDLSVLKIAVCEVYAPITLFQNWSMSDIYNSRHIHEINGSINASERADLTLRGYQ